MEDLLRSKGMHQVTLGKEKKAIDDEKKFKWANRNDKEHGLIIMSISLDLRFHLQEIDDPDEVWENIESVFGKHNIIQSHQLENKILNLSPNDFY
jgi:hypothetical protein